MEHTEHAQTALPKNELEDLKSLLKNRINKNVIRQAIQICEKFAVTNKDSFIDIKTKIEQRIKTKTDKTSEIIYAQTVLTSKELMGIKILFEDSRTVNVLRKVILFCIEAFKTLGQEKFNEIKMTIEQ